MSENTSGGSENLFSTKILIFTEKLLILFGVCVCIFVSAKWGLEAILLLGGRTADAQIEREVNSRGGKGYQDGTHYGHAEYRRYPTYSWYAVFYSDREHRIRAKGLGSIPDSKDAKICYWGNKIPWVCVKEQCADVWQFVGLVPGILLIGLAIFIRRKRRNRESE